MFKYIFGIVFIALFTACSAPKPETKPSWYISPVKDSSYFYSVGQGNNIKLAKKKAIVALRKQIEYELNNSFLSKKTNLLITENENIDDILIENEHLANTLSMRTTLIDKSAQYKNDTLVLIKIPRKNIFDSISKKTQKILSQNNELINSLNQKIAIKRLISLIELMNVYPKLVSLTEAKKLSISTYDTKDEFDFLNKLKTSYNKLKKEISFYVISDVNSRVFTPIIKDAIKEEGLILSSNPSSKDSVKLFITSTTQETQDYSFKQSKSLVKFSTYDLNKNELSFKQHTVIGKSRKNHQEAKEQSTISIKNKIKKSGIFGFLGLI